MNQPGAKIDDTTPADQHQVLSMPENTVQGYGKRLQSARQALGLSQEAVAAQLRLERRFVTALENEDTDSLPPAAFVRGYIRAYAQLVSCDGDRLIAQYNASVDTDDGLQHMANEHQQPESPPLRLRGWVWFAVIAIVSLSVWFYWNHLKPTGLSPASTPETAVEPNESVTNSTTTVVQTPETSSDNVVPAVESADSESGQSAELATTETETISLDLAVESAPAPTSDDANATETIANTDAAPFVEPTAVGNDTLTLVLNGSSWVEARDANGVQLITGLFDASSGTLQVQGQAPFQLILGDARWLEIKINNKSIDLQRYIRSNYTARLLVPED